MAANNLDMAANNQPRIVALVLSHNAPQALERCLGAIADQTTTPDEIVVVDNASSPPVNVDTLPEVGAPLRVLRSETNLGPAGGSGDRPARFSALLTDTWVDQAA